MGKKQGSEQEGAMFCLERGDMRTYTCLYFYKALKG